MIGARRSSAWSWARVWRRLGAEVTVLEFLDRILPGMDAEVAKAFAARPDQAGHQVPSSAPRSAPTRGRRRQADASSRPRAARPRRRGRQRAGRGRPRGRTPTASGWRAVGVKLDERGLVEVDAITQTNVAGRLGDRRRDRGPMLAHKAEDEGVAVAEPSPASGPRQLRRHPVRHLHLARGRLGRPDRGAAQGRGHRLQGRQVPVHRQRPRPRDGRHRRAS